MKRLRKLDLMKVLALCVLAIVLCSPTPASAGKKAPETPAAQLEFGVQMAKRGLWSEALFRFKQAERSDPQNPKILNNMAVSFEALGQFEKALDYYQRAIKVDRGNRDLRRNYSRFIEFYRAFKPDEVEGKVVEDALVDPEGR